MSFSLLADVEVRKITELEPQWFSARDIRLVLLDFDNTIVPYTTDVPTAEMTAWLDRMKQTDITVCIVSNSRKDRVPRFCQEHGLDCITHAKKPFSKGIRECLEKYDIPAKNAALVGDQIYTDTLGANCVGVTSILVSAINNHNFWLKARHVLELPFILPAKKRRM